MITIINHRRLVHDAKYIVRTAHIPPDTVKKKNLRGEKVIEVNEYEAENEQQARRMAEIFNHSVYAMPTIIEIKKKL